MVNGERLTLLDYSSTDETTLISQSSPSVCVWTTFITDLSAKNVSNCFFASNTAQFLVAASQCIHSITIEDNLTSDNLPHIIKVLGPHRGCTLWGQTSLGCTRAIVVDRRDRVAWLINYTSPVNILRKPLLSTFPDAMRRVPVMDEESGRVVIPGFVGSRDIIIADFAVLFMQ